jgi:hypothetical protein
MPKSKPMGRPPRTGKAATESLGRVKLTTAELEAVREAAADAGMSLSDYVRKRILPRRKNRPRGV